MDADTVIITGPSIGNCPLVLRPPVIPNIPLIDTVHFASISQGSSSRSFEPELVPPFNIASTAEVWSGPRFKLRGPSPTPWSDQPVLLHKFVLCCYGTRNRLFFSAASRCNPLLHNNTNHFTAPFQKPLIESLLVKVIQTERAQQ